MISALITGSKAALLRLNLTHLNRIRLPGLTTQFQGQLAIVAREDDIEMEGLFKPLDVRLLPAALYLGPELPLKAFRNRHLIHAPLVEVIPRPIMDPLVMDMLEKWESFTHLIFTSKNTVRILIEYLRKKRIPISSLEKKISYAVGSATAEILLGFGVIPLIAEEETAEGLTKLIDEIPQKENPYILWPHSSLSRRVIADHLSQRKLHFYECSIYDTEPLKNSFLPDLTLISEVIFSSPSTVRAFFEKVLTSPQGLKLTPIGQITAEELAKYRPFEENRLKRRDVYASSI